MLCTVASTLPISAQTVIPKGQTVTDDISQEEIDNITIGCKQKMEELQNYLNLIPNKDLSLQERRDARDQAINLFYSPDVLIEIEDSKGKRSMTVKKYFFGLLNTPIKFYDRIEITFYKAAYMSDLVKDPEGNLRGTGTIFQEFKGEINGTTIYRDRTKKDISLLSEVQYKDFEEHNWFVRLGEVKVSAFEKLQPK